MANKQQNAAGERVQYSVCATIKTTHEQKQLYTIAQTAYVHSTVNLNLPKDFCFSHFSEVVTLNRKWEVARVSPFSAS